MNYTQILLRPHVSEKATLIKSAANQVVFQVHPSANKIEVKKAVQDAFDVKVSKVNIARKKTLTQRKANRRLVRDTGFRKAYVTLAEGEKIDFFEGV
ncbi:MULTISPECIES: 50S ribosomal protein L23 [Desulfonatronum]|jgi:large subunit ribosomal protein L23|uniref:50S ribosomal protein L23 n=1 Tax=Desulfonatronum TaxID=66848 RepID=UPI0004ABE062|nr:MULTISPECIES: 50S ribosomal protein L23 [Desulfonatronum]PTN37368.1 50S ribosomal protein L23 [Desulfonatronum sp. SC1]